MKEMCRKFICNNNHYPQESNSPSAKKLSNTTISSDTATGNCSYCVIERIGLAQAFVPAQPYTAPMDQEQSLICGTAFSELAMPYCAGWNLYRFGKEA